ncbi:hypothetical protein D3C79_1051920 [compost metagenome]
MIICDCSTPFQVLVTSKRTDLVVYPFKLSFSFISTIFPLNTAFESSNSSSTLGKYAHEQALVIKGKEPIIKMKARIVIVFFK